VERLAMLNLKELSAMGRAYASALFGHGDNGAAIDPRVLGIQLGRAKSPAHAYAQCKFAGI